MKMKAFIEFESVRSNNGRHLFSGVFSAIPNHLFDGKGMILFWQELRVSATVMH